ncbi:hypothetical protein G7Y31_03025 [Corynebacterium lizhenjunii]|uniref:Uncharacterized protein n=1 Tax=Corynebacterium lizhenjunii TaxID=2709394 RepID=A0A7T0PAB3_9CORY|nr:hypothetical protein [Corynebacterium lizhenjunii]QPK79693.1 hypothetical protein G7Y31_03025 [Corynebacterium lizhenjunii]
MLLDDATPTASVQATVLSAVGAAPEAAAAPSTVEAAAGTTIPPRVHTARVSTASLYTPIPGYAHLKVLRPPDPVRYERTDGELTEALHTELLDPINFVLEVAAGRRPVHHLRSPRFHLSVSLHLGAWRRNRGTTAVWRFELISLHAQLSGEFHGSAVIGPHHHAFTGLYRNGVVRSFRLL